MARFQFKAGARVSEYLAAEIAKAEKDKAKAATLLAGSLADKEASYKAATKLVSGEKGHWGDVARLLGASGDSIGSAAASIKGKMTRDFPSFVSKYPIAAIPASGASAVRFVLE